LRHYVIHLNIYFIKNGNTKSNALFGAHRSKVNTGMKKLFLGTSNFLMLLYVTIVRDIRKNDGNALVGLFKEIMQTLMMIAVFYAMINVLGLRGVAVRGNFILYLLTGIFLFLTHIKAVGKVAGSGSATNQMLNHAPVSTLMLILAAALSTLYIQILAMGVILFFTHVLIEEITFYSFKGFMLCLTLGWSSGVAIGLVFLSLSQFFPTAIGLVTMLYQRSNMVFSGKMFLANTLPGYLLPMFLWNPLFHLIDQSRGYTFINYTPRYTNLTYPIILTFVFIIVGMMLEHWARKYVSASWASRR
jgi:ABC-type polysaccharide/polyol phosphate export permease